MEISFSELRCKTVVNLVDGRRLGHIIDFVFEQNTAKVLGVVVPGGKGGLFKSREDLFIPYQCICKIGFDTILVELSPVTPTVVASKVNSQNYVPASAIYVENGSEKAKRYTTYSPDNY